MANIRPVPLTIPITDVSTAQSVTVAITDDMAGKITQVKSCLSRNISNRNFDTKVTVQKNSTVLGTITIQGSGSAMGDIDTLDITGLTAGEVKSGDYIALICDGVTTIAAGAMFTVNIMR